MNLKLTVIISYYNRPDLLRFALLSLAAQSRPPDEVIVTDDGSSVDMPTCLHELALRCGFPLIYVTHPDDGFRLAKCRNNALRIAKGDLIVSTDQDIVFTPDYLRAYENNHRPGRFMVSYPVRLDEAQTRRVTEERVSTNKVGAVVTDAQRSVVRKWHRKDATYRWLYRFGLRRIGPKLRGGVFAADKADLFKVNGFDERYQGWGNEDDDLGHRLYSSGVTGRNVSPDQFPIHLHHPTHAGEQPRPNKAYYERRKLEIAAGDFVCEHGIENPLGGDQSVVTVVKAS